MGFFDDPSYLELFSSITAMKQRREAFVEEIESGSFTLAQMFSRASTDPVLKTMKVLGAVEALPETGKVSTRRAFGDLGISEAGLIGDVSIEQIEQLPAAIERHLR